MSFFSYGPNTPPPGTGDWTVDQPGNNVNNTTILLDGNLNVTTGDLTLDNVTLIINCTSDGQYGINVSAEGTLNVTNCNITPFNGSLHYKFAVYGNMTMDRCNVSEMWGNQNDVHEGGGLSLFSDGTRIRSTTIYRSEASGVQVHGNASPEIIDSKITDNVKAGIVALDTSSPVVTDCTLADNNSVSIYMLDASKPIFTNCAVIDDRSDGILVVDSSAPVFSNCTVMDCAGNGLEVGKSAQVAATNCTFTGNNWSGFITFSTATSVFANCTCCGNLVSGMQAAGTAPDKIMNCTFTGNQVCGIETFRGSAPVVTDCTFKDNVHCGITIYDASIPVITDCTAINNGYNGIQVSTLSRSTITNCLLKGNGGSGILVDHTSTAVITNCTSRDNHQSGITFLFISAPVVTGCAFINNTLGGIEVTESAQPTITDCSILSNNGGGVIAEVTSAPVFEHCTCMNNSGHGIEVLGSARPTITNCTFTANTWCGMDASDTSSPVFTNCTSTDNAWCGITIYRESTPVLTGCTSKNNTKTGLQITETARPVVTACTIADNGWDGITVFHTATPQFTNCTSKGNSMSGIVVNGTSTSAIAGCTFTDNKYAGIVACGASMPTFTNCALLYNNKSGLSIIESASPLLNGLYIAGNAGENVWITSTAPVVLANSTLAGGSTFDMRLFNNSRLTLLNTTYTKQALLEGAAQLKVQWYLTFTLFDRALNRVTGATVEGSGRNDSRISSIVSGPDGAVRDLIATEYIQNSTSSNCELTYYSPYDFIVTKGGETNITPNLPISRSLSWKLYIDFAPHMTPIPDQILVEDKPFMVDLQPCLTDPDNPLSFLSFTVDRDYATVDNSTHILTICCPYDIQNDILTITVSDGLKNSSQTVNLIIVLVNDRPYCRVPIPDMNVTEDETLIINLTDYFWDEESGPQLTFTCNREEIAIDNELRQASWTPGEGNSFLEGVIFTASDGDLTGDSNEFNITFIPVNDPPICLGGLEGKTVQEHKNWTVNLDNYFWDEEDTKGLIFESSNPEVTVNIKHLASWTPTGNSSYSIEVVFTAHDASNYSMTVSSNPITLRYQPVNDPPVYFGKLNDVRLKLGEEWNITLEDYFRDEDTEVLRFSVNNPDVKIIELAKNKHVAVWKPTKYFSNITGLVFTAYDGNAYVKSAPIDLTFDAPGEPGGQSQITRILQSIPWYVYALLPVGILGGLAAFYSYRRVKYGKYEVEQIFLVYNDGRLLAHKSKKPLEEGGEDIISGMLTALQGFIRESLKDEKQGELDEMKYGDLKIAIERGEKVYLAAFLSGYITDKFKAEMRGVLDSVDKEFGEVLQSWDGTVAKLKGVKEHLDELMGEKKPAVKEPTAPAKPAPAPGPESTKKLLQRVIAQLPSGAPGEEVTLKSELEFYQGFLRLKVAVKNGMPTNITRAAIALMYNDQALRLDHIEPEYERSGTQVIIGVLDPGEKKTAAFYLDPQICTESHIEGVLTYKDARGNLETLHMSRKLASVVCPIFYTDENINTAMLKRMTAEELDKKDAKVFTIPAELEVQKAFEIGKAAVEHHDVRLVREFSAEEPYRGEAWYYGKAKGREDKIIIRVRVVGEKRLLEFFVASTSTLMLTGLLAELKSDLNKELVSRKAEGELSQVTDAEAVRQLVSEGTLLERATEGEDKPG